MKRFCWTSMFLTLAVGCGQNNSSSESSYPASNDSSATSRADEPLPEGVVLVTLKLPGMT